MEENKAATGINLASFLAWYQRLPRYTFACEKLKFGRKIWEEGLKNPVESSVQKPVLIIGQENLPGPILHPFF